MIKVCQMCNQEFNAERSCARFCPDCRIERGRIRARARGGWKPSARADLKQEKKKEKPAVSIEEQARRAKAAGMTYGQYVAKYGEVEE